MAIHSNDISSTDAPPAVYVDKLSFRYRSPDDEPEPGRKRATPGAESPEQPPAIEDISFALPAGELLLIAGPSGCGKSTLLKCLNGLIPNSYHGILGGEIELEGRSIRGLTLRDLAQVVGTMLQDPDKQIIASTVEQEIAFGMENLHTPRMEMRKRTWLTELHARQIDRLLITLSIAGFVTVTTINILGNFYVHSWLHFLHMQGIPPFLAS